MINVRILFLLLYIHNIPPKSNESAIVTTLQRVEASGNSILQAQVLGYSLLQNCPNFDRILIIADSIVVSKSDMKVFKKFYTFVQYLPPIQFQCGDFVAQSQEESSLFKIHAWGLTQYQKVLFISSDSLLVLNISSVFDYKPASSIPRYDFWNISLFGPVFDSEFFLLKPINDHITEMNRVYCSLRENARWNVTLLSFGSVDNAILNYFYQGSVFILPYWYNFLLPGPATDGLNNITRINDTRIISMRFSPDTYPWVRADNRFASLWFEQANLMMQTYSNDTTEFSFVKSKRVDSLKKSINRLVVVDDNEQALLDFQEFKGRSHKAFVAHCISLLVICNSILFFSLTFEVLEKQSMWNEFINRAYHLLSL